MLPPADRTQVKFASAQLGFTTHVALPTFRLMKRVLPRLAPIPASLEANIEQWKVLAAHE